MCQKQREKTSRMQKRLAAVLLTVLFLLGALMSGTYGVPWDEKTEEAILNANMREYLHCFGLERVIPPYTGTESEYRISTSIEKDHGIAAYYPIGMYILQRDSRPTKEVSFVWQSYTYLVNFLGVLALYGLVTALYGSRALGLFAAAMYFFTPRMFAEMHFNNKDMVCLTLVLLTLYFGVRWIQTHRNRFAVLFAVAGAFAANARLIAAFAFGLVGVTYLLLYLRDRRGEDALPEDVLKKRFRQGILAILVCGLTYLLITPAMWMQPLRFIKYLIVNTVGFSRWNGTVLFNGMRYGNGYAALPRSYLPTMIGITTPIWLLILTVLGTAAVWYRVLRAKRLDTDALLPAMVSVMWLFPLLLAVGLNTFVYNGWRQFYFVYGPMMVCAAAGIVLLRDFLKRYGKTPMQIGAGVLALCLLASAVGIFKNHPMQSGYCNALAGENAEQRFELDYWHLASGPLIRDLTESLDAEAQITVGSVGVYDEHALNAAHKLLTPAQQAQVVRTYDVRASQYVLLNLSYLHTVSDEIDPLTPLAAYPQQQPTQPSEEFSDLCYVLENFREHSRATSYGNTMMILYERNDTAN